MFMAAVDAAAEQVRAKNPDVGYGASLADALVVMAESYLANGPAARKSGDRYQVVVSVDADVLAFDTDGECMVHNGPALAAETARRLSCDTSAVLVVRGPTGEVLDIGRKTRTIPPAIKRALRTRDTTCRWPGCDEKRVPRRPSRHPLGTPRADQAGEPRSPLLASPLPGPRRRLDSRDPRRRIAAHHATPTARSSARHPPMRSTRTSPASSSATKLEGSPSTT